MGSSFRKTIRAFFAMMLVLASIAVAGAAQAQGSPEKRIAFVVGNAAYQAGALSTSANDAGLIAQTLQAAGFDVIGARDLDQNGLRDAIRDFLAKANASGPDTVVFVYLAGYGVQYQGDNYFVPVDAQIANATDVPLQALRMGDFTKSLAALNNRGSIVVLDAARANPFVQSNQPLAGGLVLVDPDANQLIAFNAAPGTVAPQEPGPYGSYAHALAEMIRVGGLSLGDVFDRTRLRVSDLTKGAQISWDASKFTNDFTFFDRGPNAPAAQVSSYDSAAIRTKAIRDFNERDAYFAALDRDTMQGYEDFLAAYPHDAMAKRVRAIIAARREAITWRETWAADTPEAYWSYLRRYPRGPHVWDARRRLEHFEAALEPPPSFTVIEYDVPPPPPEIVYVERRDLYFDDSDFGYAPPPPVVFLAPPPPDFVVLAPPQYSDDIYVLPAPVFVPVQEWVDPPRNVAPPQNDIIFNNIHNTVTNNTIVNESGAAPAAPAAPGLTTGQKLGAAAVIAGAGAAALHVALPPSVQKKAAVQQKQNPAPAVGTAPATGPAVAPSVQPQGGNAARALPGTSGQPLPPAGKLLSNQGAPQAKQAQPPQAAPNAIQNPAVAPQPAQRGANAKARALPSSKGQPLPPVGNAPAVKGQNQIAKTPAPPQAAPSVQPNTAVAAPKPNVRAQTVKPPTPPAVAKVPPKPAVANKPPVSNQPPVAAAPPRHANPLAAQPKPAPRVAVQPKAPPPPKPQAQPRPQPQPQAQPRPQPQPQPRVIPQQVKPPPAPQKPPAAPQKPQVKKPCGAPGLPACQ
ncbi:caspase family protein [Rhizobium mayense]|uniref:Caspase family protein n=2 Tax=Rhizobium mayense TaxID=1312184 RepID=A0ABT7JZ92_9HYPH|nr:caspase family protein [Rhizobium mayense]MDL2400508.1 caspase family protein [Rhizobium mayense]